jgi:hypothetical protein
MCGSAVSAFMGPSNRRRENVEPARICAKVDCETVLSRFNKTELCGVHEPERTMRNAQRKAHIPAPRAN